VSRLTVSGPTTSRRNQHETYSPYACVPGAIAAGVRPRLRSCSHARTTAAANSPSLWSILRRKLRPLGDRGLQPSRAAHDLISSLFDLFFGCRHDHASLPRCGRQVCFDCGAERGYSTFGAQPGPWTKGSAVRAVEGEETSSSYSPDLRPWPKRTGPRFFARGV
jgi:hypothetical protein